MRRSLIFIALSLLAAPLWGQEFRAEITGIVRDKQGSAIPAAALEITSLETNEVTRTVTNASGYYAVPALGIGLVRGQNSLVCAATELSRRDEQPDHRLTPTEPIAFIQQHADTLRTLSIRFSTIRPPKVPNVDCSLFKAFTLHEGVRLQFRAEAFNTLNAPRLGAPSTSLGSTVAASAAGFSGQ